jgi:hypothetical protein
MSESLLDVIVRFLKEGTGDMEAKEATLDLGNAFERLTGISLSTLTATGLLVGGFSLLKGAIEDTVEYAMDVKDFALALGITTEEASKLIQMGDDLRVSQETLQSAFRFALNQGIVPNVEGLIKLSEKMLAIEDPAARMQFAIQTFGRGAAVDMLRFLEQGPEGLREMADALEDSALVMSQDAVDAADEYRLALDELEDDWTAMKMDFVLGIMNIADSINQLSDDYDEFNQAVEDGIITQREARVVITALENGSWTYDKALEFLNEHIRENAHSEGERAAILWEAQAALSAVEDATTDLAEATPALVTAIAEVSGGFDEAKESGDLLRDGLDLISDSMVEQQRVALVLEIATGNLSAAEIEQRLSALDNLAAMEQLNGALESGAISQYEWIGAMSDGIVTQAEVNALLGITEETITDIEEGLQNVDGVNAHASISLDVDVTGGGSGSVDVGGVNLYMARGGLATVPPGHPNDSYLVGLSSGEQIIVIPSGAQTTKNFNLSIYSNSPSERIIDDFGLMEAWSR